MSSATVFSAGANKKMSLGEQSNRWHQTGVYLARFLSGFIKKQ